MKNKYNVYVYDGDDPATQEAVRVFKGIDYSSMINKVESATQGMDFIVVVEAAPKEEEHKCQK